MHFQTEVCVRDFFIQSFEKLVSVIVGLMTLGAAIVALVALAQQGFLAFLAILIIGAIYVVLIGGGLYLGLGI